MIKVANLTKTYGSQVLFQEAGFHVNPGERIGLVGRNGHGKSTLFRLLTGQESADSGEISMPNNYTMGYLDQILHFTQPTVLAEACLGLSEASKFEEWRVEKILSGLGFTEEDMQKSPALFSGGFQVRINLARVLVGEPNMLLLDEPTNYLDVVSVRWLIRFLNAWPNELMLITHDRSFMDRVATHILSIHRCKMKKIQGDTEKMYTQIAQEEEIHEKTRLNVLKREKEVERFISRFRAKARLANMVQSRIKMLDKMEKPEKLERLKTLDFSFKSEPFPSKYMLQVKDLGFSYSQSPPFLIQGLDLVVHTGDRIGVIGKNGKGKSTLLRLLKDELSPVKGSIDRHPRLKVGYFGQTNLKLLNDHLTVLEEIVSPDPEHDQKKARDVCGCMLFSGDDALKRISVLSGGERSRVLLGKLLMTPSQLLLLDEPTNHLDLESSDSLLAAMDDFEGAILFVTHNEMFLSTLANRLIIFDRDRVFVYEGGYQHFLRDVGWAFEEQEKKTEKIKSDKNDGNRSNKKEQRRRRAEIIEERSRALRPLKVEMDRIETAIKDSERQVTRNYTALEEAAVQGNALEMARIAKENKTLEEQAEKLYKDLDRITRDHETKTAEFQKIMEDLSE